MNREDRITRYEQMLDRVEQASEKTEEARKACDAVRSDLEAGGARGARSHRVAMGAESSRGVGGNGRDGVDRF